MPLDRMYVNIHRYCNIGLIVVIISALIKFKIQVFNKSFRVPSKRVTYLTKQRLRSFIVICIIRRTVDQVPCTSH